MKVKLAFMAWLVVALLVVGFLAVPRPATATHFVLPEIDALVIDVQVGDSRSVMGQRTMTQVPHASGPSAERLAFTFDAPVELTGALISVDVAGPQLVEFVAAINPEGPYTISGPNVDGHQPFGARDWLLHVSDSNNGPSKIDEHIWFADPFRVGPDDVVTVDAWLGNPHDYAVSVSPEVILFWRASLDHEEIT